MLEKLTSKWGKGFVLGVTSLVSVAGGVVPSSRALANNDIDSVVTSEKTEYTNTLKPFDVKKQVTSSMLLCGKGMPKDWLENSLRAAAFYGDTEAIKRCLQQGADVNFKGRQGTTSLHLAAMNGHIDAVKLLVDHGAQVNAKDNYGWTSLHNAAWYGHADTIKTLVNLGAQIDVKTNDENYIPLHYAANNGHINAIKALANLGSDVNAKTREGETPLHLAKKNGHAEAAKVLSELGGIE